MSEQKKISGSVCLVCAVLVCGFFVDRRAIMARHEAAKVKVAAQIYTVMKENRGWAEVAGKQKEYQARLENQGRTINLLVGRIKGIKKMKDVDALVEELGGRDTK